jgi:hypothetical protein
MKLEHAMMVLVVSLFISALVICVVPDAKCPASLISF